jgi:hypothetical protein
MEKQKVSRGLNSVFAVGIALLLVGCSVRETDVVRLPSASFIEKGEVVYPERMEATPVVFNGEVIDVVSARGAAEAFGSSVELYSGGVLRGTVSFPFGFVSAIVVADRLFVFGTSDWSRPGNHVAVVSSSDLVTWSAPEVVLTAEPGEVLLNTSVAPTPDGFVMASERCRAGVICFRVEFFRSPDLRVWTPVGGPLRTDTYTACPTVRFSDGWYYVTYLASERGYFRTLVARSRDLLSWEYSPQTVVSPDAGAGEGENASDFDLVEMPDGSVRMLYAIGYQTAQEGAFVSIREARFSGSLSEFFRLFFE